MEIFNTLTKKKEQFKPLIPGEVSFYQCGPTVYWTQHLGNLRAATLGDIVYRTLAYFGYKVNFVRNYTDVGHLTSDGDTGEDKMEKGVKREGLSPKEIAEKYIKIYEDDIRDLNLVFPTSTPHATEYVPEMIKMVQTLLDKGFAYATPLAVYFDTTKAKDYTRLSGQDLSKNREGAGQGDVEDPEKKHSQDFSVWFFKAGKHANALQFWPSPFTSPLVQNGEGFPGWHIECSAMIKKLLGETIDIHMGGNEHIPVHHTNEIAQSESANGKPFVNYWLHNEWLLVNNGKMAKSEGTAFSLSDAKEKGFSPMAVRYFYLQAHYRSKQNFTWEALQSAANGYDRLVKSVKALGDTVGKVDEKLKEEFMKKIGNDFNSPQALAMVFSVLKADISKEDRLATILDFDKVLGLKLS